MQDLYKNLPKAVIHEICSQSLPEGDDVAKLPMPTMWPQLSKKDSSLLESLRQEKKRLISSIDNHKKRAQGAQKAKDLKRALRYLTTWVNDWHGKISQEIIQSADDDLGDGIEDVMQGIEKFRKAQASLKRMLVSSEGGPPVATKSRTPECSPNKQSRESMSTMADSQMQEHQARLLDSWKKAQCRRESMSTRADSQMGDDIDTVRNDAAEEETISMLDLTTGYAMQDMTDLLGMASTMSDFLDVYQRGSCLWVWDVSDPMEDECYLYWMVEKLATPILTKIARDESSGALSGFALIQLASNNACRLVVEECGGSLTSCSGKIHRVEYRDIHSL